MTTEFDSAPAVDEAALVAAGWVSPARVAELEAFVAQIAAGDYLNVPRATDCLSTKLRHLAGTLGRHGSSCLKRTVAISVSLNQGAFSTAQALRDAAHASDCAQTIASAAEQLVASVETIAANSAHLARDTEQVNVVANQGAVSAEQAIDAMQGIAFTVNGAAQRVDTLSQASEEIGKIVGVIEEIAFHTNMLALNASVEAARAGDAGRGFAVVAEEVKRLATQTKQATVEIGGRINRLRIEMNGIVASMQEVGTVVAAGRDAIGETGCTVRGIANSVKDMAGRIRDVASILDQQRVAAQNVAQDVGALADTNESMVALIHGSLDLLEDADTVAAAQLDDVSTLSLPNIPVHRAKADHVIWKRKLATMLIGRTDLKSEELADHHQCRLGKWYDTVGAGPLRDNPAFHDLIHPHTGVHAHGKRAVDLYNKGDIAGAVAELAEADRQSVAVLELLNELAP